MRRKTVSVALRVDTNQLEWENGLAVAQAMAPEFGDNLGPAELVVRR